MTTDTALLQQALDALETTIEAANSRLYGDNEQSKAISAIKARLAQPEQEPFAWENEDNAEGIKLCYRKFTDNAIPLYTHPQPARKPLTDEGILDLYFNEFSIGNLIGFARAIEKAHGIE